jgi:hypothetical protein
MALYELDQWEHNGYDDSDWFAVVYDSDKDKLDRVLIGTTRGAFPPPTSGLAPGHLAPTPEIIEKARIRLRDDFIRPRVEHSENQRIFVLDPKDIKRGLAVRFNKEHAALIKDFDREPCYKCKGSGHWQNPRDPEDKRECFTCHGEGTTKTNFRKRLDADGKPVKLKVAAGTKAMIVGTKSYGQFYRNGYNQPDGHNSTAFVALADGTEVGVPLHKLQLDEDMPSAEQMDATAERLSHNKNFYAPFRTANVRV